MAPERKPQARPKAPLELLREAGLGLGEESLFALAAHFELLLRWNEKMNLTAVREPVEILRRHFLESLTAMQVVEFGPGVLYDIGTGPGFPGLPLKAACPQIELFLVEASLKKAAFLKEVVRAAALERVHVEAARVETLLERSELELADWVTMRAVGGVTTLVPLLRRLLVPHGQILLYLGENDAGEVRNNVGGFNWRPAHRIPGSERRVILVGEVL
jgi:16S rRNA (guanine527-N7)-methyltransferase